MSFEELLTRLHRRCEESSSEVSDEAGLAEAAELWRLAQPADRRHPTPGESHRLLLARHACGLLRFHRWAAVAAESGVTTDLAHAILFLEPVSGDLDSLPAALRLVLGPSAELDATAAVAYGLLDLSGTTPDPAPLDACIVLFTNVVAALNDDSVEADSSVLAGYLAALAGAHRTRYHRTGGAGDIDRALELIQAAVAAGPGYPALRSNLALAHYDRYQRTGNLADLQETIDLGEKVFSALPPGDPLRPELAANLGNAYRERHERIGLAADLDRAVELGRQAIDAIPEDHPERARHLGNLSVTYGTYYRLTSDPDDLARAFELGEQALAAAPGRHPERPASLTNLAAIHGRRYERTGLAAEVDRAIERYEEALAATPDGRPDRPLRLANLAAAHHHRHRSTGDLTDLERAVELAEQAVAATPEDHPDRTRFLANLGTHYHFRRAAGGRGIDRETLRAFISQVNAAADAGPLYTSWANRVAGLLAQMMDEHVLAVPLFDRAIALQPSLVPREAGLADQERRIGEQAGLVTDAVSAHCAVGDLRGAIEIAELGRSVLLETGPDNPDSRPGSPRTADNLDNLGEGAAVLVNAGRRRGDAIIIASGDPIHVHLPDLTSHELAIRVMALLDATRDARFRKRLPKVLGWLWDTAVGPILDALGAAVPAARVHNGQSRPRVWWLPIGLLGLCPLHAAGHPGQLGALDAVVSSYTPTLRALAESRARTAPSQQRSLIVTMERTPGFPDLPGTVAEAAALHALHPGAAALSDHRATAQAVLAALPEATWAHFACHATADYVAPSRSGLQLHDGTLPVAEINRLRLPDAELAYLSACSTAMHGVRQVDQSIHLASAFQLAGFRHVIASLWPLNDRVAATAARSFYDQLAGAPGAGRAAEALHRVTVDLRETFPGSPDLWAPLIHAGP